LIAASAIFPLIFMLFASFRSELDWERSKLGLPTSSSLGAFRHAWVAGNVEIYFRNSVVIVLCTLVATVVLATMGGYAFSKLYWRGSGKLYLFLLAWMAIPPLLLMVPIYVEMVQLHILDTYWSVVCLYTAINLPFNVYLMSSFFRALPDELIEAAEIDGASIHRTFLNVLLPLAKPALATLVIFNFLYVWNEFVFALLLLPDDSVKPLTVGILQLEALGGKFTTYWPGVMAGLLIASLPVVGVYLVFQKYLVRGIVAGAAR
jgi:ABC-type glycerol-3-phosphate transport system permease component